jgi:hypothetical protein
MAFITINPTMIEVGEPTRKELFQTIKDNLDDHEGRIAIAENAVNLAQTIDFELLGNYNFYSPIQGVLYKKLINNILVQGVKLHQFKAYTSGTTEIDILYKRGVNPFVSIFSIRPTVTAANGDFFTSNNGTVITPNLLADDILRLDITSSQSGGFDTHSLTVALEYEVA